ncbi:Rho termination factor, N-terminal domain [Desulfacinum infernum DSM 9756]|uniref:Rho termination factor, N-terminal domain n=1 Tax=Desulfacinum infernum DSM 9756 TaxID=1121391 RepID=A0A1M4STB4_9BACT|nr:Rho termination factor N-terminal domain-containing protein [Desulfacinum infernum]SHE35436.1 Rho termination factor, N-terminal domain [Desulfacinum infernum DSM 9756]
MGKKKEKEVKEKPLEKMTAKELREVALGLEGIVGVHAMNKAELIAAIKEAKGIVEESTKKKSVDVRALKAKIRELRARREEAKAAGNNKLADALRRRISNLKKKTRRAA